MIKINANTVLRGGSISDNPRFLGQRDRGDQLADAIDLCILIVELTVLRRRPQELWTHTHIGAAKGRRRFWNDRQMHRESKME